MLRSICGDVAQEGACSFLQVAFPSVHSGTQSRSPPASNSPTATAPGSAATCRGPTAGTRRLGAGGPSRSAALCPPPCSGATRLPPALHPQTLLA